MDGNSEIAPDRAARNTITLDELQAQVGAPPRHSRWYVLDQKRIDAFADVTEDWQWIHTEPERAVGTPFGGTIAHGFLTLSMLSAMTYDATPEVEGAAMGVNYGFNRIRFTNPVKAGQKVRAKFITRDVTERSPGNWVTTTGVTVEIDGESRPALTAEWIGLTVMETK